MSLAQDRTTTVGLLLSGKRFGLNTACTLAVPSSSLAIAAFAMAETSFAILLSFILFGVIGFVFARRIDNTAVRLYLIVYAFSAIAAIALY